MLPRPGSAVLSSSGSRCTVFPKISDQASSLARRRWPPPARSPSPWTCPHIAVDFQASPLSHEARTIRCSAGGSSAEAATAVKWEASETEDVAVEMESGASAGQLSAEMSVGVGTPSLPVQLRSFRMSLGDQAFFALAFIACTTSVAFASLVIATIPTLFAMRRAAISLAKLADTAREELPSTMAAIRLSGMEISDLTLELSDLSQEIAEGISKSAQAVQAAEAGIRRMGQLARQQTMTMIEERASLPDISLQPVVNGAAQKTSNVITQVRKTLFNFISRGGE